MQLSSFLLMFSDGNEILGLIPKFGCWVVPLSLDLVWIFRQRSMARVSSVTSAEDPALLKFKRAWRKLIAEGLVGPRVRISADLLLEILATLLLEIVDIGSPGLSAAALQESCFS